MEREESVERDRKERVNIREGETEWVRCEQVIRRGTEVNILDGWGAVLGEGAQNSRQRARAVFHESCD